MTEELGPILQEIADLLRERVEQNRRIVEIQEERQKVREEKLAKIDRVLKGEEGPFSKVREEFTTGMPDLKTMQEESRKRMEQIDRRQEEDRQERREFQGRLLAELERHNAALEKILSRLVR
jgi:hypothetical protein